MNYQKLFFLTFIFVAIFNGCSTKGKNQPIKNINNELNLLQNKIIQNCQAKNKKDQNGSIFIKIKNNTLEINLNNKSDFRNGSYVLSQESKEKLYCIIPVVKEKKGLFILITGHANDNKNSRANQHLSDNRAISLAELFFNEGIRDEMFAKGCSDKSSLKTDKINRQINIYIYTNRSNITSNCK